jgi:HPt (histidine-containing phosphotransfer) domain-containing protein
MICCDMSPAPPVTDPSVQADILDAFQGMALASLLQEFLIAIEAESAAILAHEAAQDRDGLSHAAHRLASAAAQFGFPELTQVARAIETGGATSKDSGLKGALDRVRDAAEQLQRRPSAAR